MSNYSGSQMSMTDGTWVGWFINLHCNEFLCRVPDEYLKDRFNLTGLELLVPNFNLTLHAILDKHFDTEYGFNPRETDPETTGQLYGLIHARYILTPRGIDDMAVKYQNADFGICPRVFCYQQMVLPVGLSDNMGESHVKVYCPRCRDAYQPDSRCSLLDGAMFGPSFPHMFLMQLPQLMPQSPVEKYTPRIYGFKVHESALMAPKPESSAVGNSSSPGTAAKGEDPKPQDDSQDVSSPKRRYSYSFN